MSFYSGNFSFNDIYNHEMGVYLVSLDDDVLMDYGIKYKEGLKTESSRNNQFYYSETSEVETITITLGLADKFKNPKTWTIDERRKIIDWMVTDKFCKFVSEDDTSICYYFKCVEYTKKFNSQGYGFIEFVMQPESQYAYTPVIEKVYKVNGEKEIIIENIDNVNKKYYPKIDIIQFSDSKQQISITNKSTNNKEFTLDNIEKYERVEVDHMLKSVLSNKNVFRLKDTNRSWIYLKRGANSIVLKGNCEFRIITQYQLKI